HRPPAARPHRSPHRRAPQGAVHLRRCGREAGGLTLYRGRERRPHDRRDPDQHDLAADQRRISGPHGGRAPAGRHHAQRSQRRFPHRRRMSAVMARMIELTSPLGKDLLFRSLHGHEELGRASEFQLAALSTRKDIKPTELLGKTVTIKLELVKGGYRYFNSYVTRFSQGETVGRYYEYRMIVHPWLWFLTRTADCKIFQEKTVPDIIKEVFADHPVAVFD